HGLTGDRSARERTDPVRRYVANTTGRPADTRSCTADAGTWGAAPGRVDQGDRLRGGRFGVLGLRIRREGAARAGRVAAGGRLDRATVAGPTRRTRQDR